MVALVDTITGVIWLVTCTAALVALHLRQRQMTRDQEEMMACIEKQQEVISLLVKKATHKEKQVQNG